MPCNICTITAENKQTKKHTKSTWRILQYKGKNYESNAHTASPLYQKNRYQRFSLVQDKSQIQQIILTKTCSFNSQTNIQLSNTKEV